MSGVQAQDNFPSRPLTYVVSFSAGSSPDVTARMTAPKLAARVGQQVLVDNKPGASSTIGTLFVARSKPDGYTFMHGGPTALSTAPALIKDLAYDPLRDFSAITITTEGYYVLLTAPQLKGMSLAQLVEQIAKAPENYAVGGQSISTEILHHMLGNGKKPNNTYVRYKTESGLVGDLLGGRLPLAFATISAGLAQLGTGKVGAITVSSPKRLASLPNVPIMAEVMPGTGLANYAGLYLAAKTPRPIVNYLHTHLVAVLKDPELAARTAAAGSVSLLLPPEESDAYMRRENPRWIRAIKEAGIQPE
jgi:tripartite-type tricarboxylate transporter receptor subunit TctC